MKKTYGVCVGMLAMGLAVLGAPAGRAQSLMAASDSGSGTEASASSAASSSSSPTVAAPAAVAPDDQGSPTPATPAQAATPAPAPAAAAPAPLANPSMTAPLATAIPHEISAGPFGKLQVTGILSGIGMTEGNHFFGESATHWDLSNAQVFIQKTTGWWQFYLQGGAYNIPALGVPFTSTVDTVKNVYGPFPTGYIKLVKGNFNVQVGELPTLIGAEYTFDFENMNIERGLLWGQEPAISRGIQLNETYKKLTLAFSWNDGFFSNRYTSLSGSLAYAFNAANTLSFVASGNAGAYNRKTTSLATPLDQNNSEVYNLIYTYTKGNLAITPYYQYTNVPKNTSIGIYAGAHTNGGALLANYNFKHGISLAGRAEYIRSSGNPLDENYSNSNLLGFGPGSGAFSFTVTPTYSKDGFFIRGDFSIVDATNTTPAYAVFGPAGTSTNQPRGAIEAGFIF